MIEEDISKSTGEMDEQFINEYMEAADTDTFEAFAEDWGMTVEEAHKAALDFSALDGFVPEGTTLSEPDEADTFTKNGVTIDTSGDIDPVLLGMTGGKGGMFKEGAKKLANKVLASKSLKANQKANRGVEGPVVKGASRTLKDSNLRPSIANKTADRYKSMSDKVTKDRAVKAGTTVGAATGIGLMGNRNKDGDFEKVDLGRPEPILIDEVPQETTHAKWLLDKVTPIETMGNQYGYHKQKGQNFWTVNNDDAYWDTHEMGTGDAWSDAEVKKASAKELDWSSWFN